jgi:hypothetical protein
VRWKQNKRLKNSLEIDENRLMTGLSNRSNPAKWRAKNENGGPEAAAWAGRYVMLT